MDLETQLFTGSHVQHQGKTRDRYQAEASATLFPGRSFARPTRFQDRRVHLLGSDV